MKFEFVLTGQMPILFHADDIVAADALKEWRENPENANQSIRGDDRSPPWTWMTYLYSDGEFLSIPGDNLMAALRWAGAKLILKKTTTYKVLSQSGLVLASEYIDFSGPLGPVKMADIDNLKSMSFSEQSRAVQDLGFSLFVKRAKVEKKKHARVRARFKDWSASGVIEILNPDIKPDALSKIFDIAGIGGLLDWRPSSPEKPGPFGRFTAKLKQIK